MRSWNCDHILLERRKEGLFTLDVADVGPLRVNGLAASLLCDLLLQPLDLTAQVGDDVGVLGDVVGHVDKVFFHLKQIRGGKNMRRLFSPCSLLTDTLWRLCIFFKNPTAFLSLMTDGSLVTLEVKGPTVKPMVPLVSYVDNYVFSSMIFFICISLVLFFNTQVSLTLHVEKTSVGGVNT